jgi:hypothetical protein
VDEESFQRAVRAREKRFRDDEKAEAELEAAATARQHSVSSRPCITNGDHAGTVEPEPKTPKRWEKDDRNEYPISTERAEAISRWVRDAPALTAENNTGKKKRRKGAGKKPGLSKAGSTGLEGSVASLGVDEEVE